MRKTEPGDYRTSQPLLSSDANELVTYIRTLSIKQISSAMQISPKLAESVMVQFNDWVPSSDNQKPAIDTFIGDIYSGLQVQTWSQNDRDYAQSHLRILSGLYGVLRPLDAVAPYRLEMGYHLPKAKYKSLYSFWGDKISAQLDDTDFVVDLTAVEYSKAIKTYLDKSEVIRPKFLTVSPKTGDPTFVVVHAKIARGAFAAWLIKQRISDSSNLADFAELNYRYSKDLSTPTEPVYICSSFGGLGLSVRLT